MERNFFVFYDFVLKFEKVQVILAMEQTVQTAQTNPFATEKISKLIARFAIPSIVSMVVNSLYNIVDQIFIGQGVGYLGNAATNVAFPLVTICFAFALLVGDGCAAYLSLKLGAGDKESAAKGVANAIVMLGILGIFFFVMSFALMIPLLNLFGATENVLPYAIEYTQIIIIGLPFVIMSTGLNSAIRADGSPKLAMISMLSGAILNTILDPIFILVFHWGVAGAAWATIIGQVVGFFIAVFYLRHFKNIQLKKSYFKLRWKYIGHVLSLGVSSFITQMAITIVVVVMNNQLTYYGAMSSYGSDIPLSALGIVMKVNSIILSFFIGLAVGSQPIIGFNYGAKNYHRVKKCYLIAVGASLVIGVIGFCIFQFAPQSVINLFGQENELYNNFALMSFRTFLFCCILNAFQVVSSIFFQAIGKPVRATILSLSRQIIFLIPAMLILPIFLRLEGILYSGPVADTLAFVLALIFILVEMRHLNKLQCEQESLSEVEVKS